MHQTSVGIAAFRFAPARPLPALRLGHDRGRKTTLRPVWQLKRPVLLLPRPLPALPLGPIGADKFNSSPENVTAGDCMNTTTRQVPHMPMQESES
jgi:hypothetical protein